MESSKVRAPELQQPLSVFGIFMASPPMDESLQLPVARFFGAVTALFMLAAVMGTYPRNSPDYLWASFAHLGTASVVMVLASSMLTLSGRWRLTAIAVALMFTSVISHIRNEDITWGLLITVAAGSMLHLTLRAWAAAGLHALGIAANGVASYGLGAEPTSNIVLYCFSAFLITGVPAVAVRYTIFQLDWNRRQAELRTEQVSALLEERSRLMNIIAQEVRIPLMTMALALSESGKEEETRERLRASVEQLRLVVDNLFSGDAMVESPPLRSEVLSIGKLVSQVQQQIAPLIESEAMKLFTDVADNADRRVIGDRFRLRTVFHNLLRNITHYSSGDRLWLNLHAADETGQEKLRLIIDVENNGPDLSHTLRDAVDADRDFHSYDQGAVALGLQVAARWLEQLGGSMRWFASPRGGDGIRAVLTLELASLGDTSTIAIQDTRPDTVTGGVISTQ